MHIAGKAGMRRDEKQGVCMLGVQGYSNGTHTTMECYIVRPNKQGRTASGIAHRTGTNYTRRLSSVWMYGSSRLAHKGETLPRHRVSGIRLHSIASMYVSSGTDPSRLRDV